jgi:hypothetical protein
MEKLFLEMDDSENTVKDIRPLTEDDDLLMLKIAKKYNLTFEVRSLIPVTKFNECDVFFFKFPV